VVLVGQGNQDVGERVPVGAQGNLVVGHRSQQGYCLGAGLFREILGDLGFHSQPGRQGINGLQATGIGARQYPLRRAHP
jgi:hypothetical protein